MGSSSSLTTTSSTQQMGPSTASISEMICTLRSAFRMVDFAQVEANLVAREEMLKQEVEAKEREMMTIKKKYQNLKHDLETRVKEMHVVEGKYRALKGDLENKVKDMKLLEEKCKLDKLEVLKLNDEIKERDSQILGLKESKSRAENEVERYRKKFQELDERILILEKDLSMKSAEPPGLKSATVSMGRLGEKNVSENGKKCEKIDNGKTKAWLSETADNINLEFNEQNANEETSAAGCKRPLPEDIVDIVDSDDDHPPRDICSAKRQRGLGQLSEHISSVSCSTSSSSDSDDDADSLSDIPFLAPMFLRGKQAKTSQR